MIFPYHGTKQSSLARNVVVINLFNCVGPRALPYYFFTWLVERVARTSRSERRGSEHSSNSKVGCVRNYPRQWGCGILVEFNMVILSPAFAARSPGYSLSCETRVTD